MAETGYDLCDSPIDPWKQICLNLRDRVVMRMKGTKNEISHDCYLTSEYVHHQTATFCSLN